jgi:hypothetical protein
MKKISLLLRISILIGVILLIEGHHISVGSKVVQGQEKEVVENQKEETSYAGVNNFRGYFSEGLAAVNKEDKGGYKGGYIDKTGNEVIPFIYEDVRVFGEGLGAVEKGHKYGYIDKAGKQIIDFSYDKAGTFSGGVAPVEKGDKWGYIDKAGKEIISFIYDYGCKFAEGLIAVEKDNKWGL